MSVGLILNFLNEFNKSILFYSTNSINLVLNMHKFNILFITYLPQKEFLIVKKTDHKRSFFTDTHIMLS